MNGGGDHSYHLQQPLHRGVSFDQTNQKSAKQGSGMQNNGNSTGSNNINVIIRVRPMTDSYQQNTVTNQTMISNASVLNTTNYNGKCIQEIKDKKTVTMPGTQKTPDVFTFDYVGDEDCQQDEIFKVAARPIVDQCLLGYNGTIFAYGQTGSGKTHTILGNMRSYELFNQSEENQMQIDQQLNSNRSFSLQNSQVSGHHNLLNNSSSSLPLLDKTQAGILPRSFEYLFHQIQRIKNQYQQKQDKGRRSARKSMAPSHQNLPTFNESCVRVEFDLKCQFIEIYNENVYDLLDTSIDQRLNIRQDSDKGIYVEGGRQEVVQNLQDVMRLVSRGNMNRTIASTQMNRESSRSHAVFITHIKTIEVLENGKQNAKISRFYIVDLAGSERCKDTGAEGIRLKEASNINKSLSVLGNVINKLSENSKQGETKPKTHVNYRDSKLTFLLQDSLGGNSKTVIICNVNPHLKAMKETKNTLQFAQRAKMIQNQAVINEDTHCVEFWKNKYQQLERQMTGGGKNALSKSSTLHKQQYLDNSIQDCDFICAKCQKDNNLLNTSKLSKQDAKDQKDYEKLNIDALKTIQELTIQLKEVKDQAQIHQIDAQKSIDAALHYKTAVKLQTELISTRAQKVRAEYDKLIIIRKSQDPTNQLYNQELMCQIDGMKALIDSQQQEIALLKSQLETNPLLVLKSCQVIEMEKKMKEYQEMYGIDEQPMSVDRKLNKLLDDVNGLIARTEHLYNSKRIDRMNQNQQDLSCIDIEMNDATKTFQQQNVNTTNNQLLMSQTIVDYTVLNQRRDLELANIKVQYEEQLETLRTQLKKEQENVHRLKSFLTQSNAQASQYTFGDEMLQNSQISTIFNLNRGQTNLLESQRITHSQQLQMPSSNTDNPFMQSMQIQQTQGLQLGNNNHNNDSIIQEEMTDQENSSAQQHQQQSLTQFLDVAEFEKLLNDCQIEIAQLTQENQNLNLQNQHLHQMIDEQTQSLQELTAKYDEAVRVRIAIETDKMQLQAMNDELKVTIEGLEQDNEEMYKVKAECERLEGDNQTLKDQIDNLQNELNTATSTNDYFAQDVLPNLQREIKTINEDFNKVKQENEQLKAMKSNDSEKDQLQAEINSLNQQLKQKDSDISKLHQALENSLQSIDEQKNYIQGLNGQYQEQQKEFAMMKEEYSQMSNQLGECRELLDDSQKSLIVSEKRIHRLEKENQIIQQNFKNDEQKYQEKLRDTLSRLGEQEHANKILKNDIENYKSENMQLINKINEQTREITEVRAKYVTYREMSNKQIEQMKLTVDTVTKYRSSQVIKSENNEQLIQKYRNEVDQLKQYLKQKDCEVQGLVKKLQTMDEFKKKLVEKDQQLKRVHELEKEVSNLKTELKINETKCQQIESNYLMKENEHKKLQEQYTSLEKEFLDLSKLGDQAKYQHLNKVRGQNNQYVKDLNALNQEMKNLKLESKSMVEMIVKFSQEVCHKLRLDNIMGSTIKNKGIIRANPQTHMREFLNELLDIIGQGFTNLHLQLETPLNVSTIKLSQDEESNSLSEESSNQYAERQQQIENCQIPNNYYNLQQQQQQNPNNFGMRQQQQQQQQQQQFKQLMNNNSGTQQYPVQNKNINLQALNQQQHQRQDRHNGNSSALDRSMELKENQSQNANVNRQQQQQQQFVNNQNQMSNQKPSANGRFINQHQQQQSGIYQVQVPINQPNRFAPNTQQQQQQQQQRAQQSTGTMNNNRQAAINNNMMRPGFNTQQQQQQQKNHGTTTNPNYNNSNALQNNDFVVPANQAGGIDFAAGMQYFQQRPSQLQQQQQQQQQQQMGRQQPVGNNNNSNNNSSNRDQSANSRMDIC